MLRYFFIFWKTRKWLVFGLIFVLIIFFSVRLSVLHAERCSKAEFELSNKDYKISNKSEATNKSTGSTRLRYITVAMQAGRLGNKLFQYASMYGCAKRYNFVPVIKGDVLDRYIAKQHIRAAMLSEAEWKTMKWRPWRESRASSYNQAQLESGLQGDGNVLLEFFLQSYRYFAGYEAEVVSQFVFSQTVLNWAAALVRNVTARMPRDRSNSTIVGLHVRRGDYLHDGAKKLGYNTPGEDYYVKAVRYFTTRYAFVAFIVCSTDFQWITDVIQRHFYNVNDTSYRSTIFELTTGSDDQPERDLAVLSLTNHSILSAGTYSFWAAMLRQFRSGMSDNGTTVYYAKPFVANTPIAETYGNSVQAYYPPSWLGFE